MPEDPKVLQDIIILFTEGEIVKSKKTPKMVCSRICR
jgi:hypothetical protein